MNSIAGVITDVGLRLISALIKCFPKLRVLGCSRQACRKRLSAYLLTLKRSIIVGVASSNVSRMHPAKTLSSVKAALAHTDVAVY